MAIESIYPGSQILIVGEAPGAEEERKGIPFVGSSGQLLTEMLTEAGINREECSITNVTSVRPPNNNIKAFFPTKAEGIKRGLPEFLGRYPTKEITEGVAHLEETIARLRPNLIIAVGDTPLWALTGETGISRWRGSIMESRPIGGKTWKVIPIYHPAYILRQWQHKHITVRDLRRAEIESKSPGLPLRQERFTIFPAFHEAMDILSSLDGREIAVDIETAGGHIACIGFGWSDKDALCIPFLGDVYPEQEEQELVLHIRRLLTSPHVKLIFQNGMYDWQHLAFWWGIPPERYTFDTMYAHHLLYPDMEKSLGFLSSLYLHNHLYWKDEGKEMGGGDAKQWYIYNCRDCVRTFAVAQHIRGALESEGLLPLWEEQLAFFHLAFQAVMWGTRIDTKRRSDTALELMTVQAEYAQWLTRLIPQEEVNPKKNVKPWYNSPKQQATLFYEQLGVKPVLKNGRPTCDDAALTTIGQREPILRPITDTLARYRSIGVLLNVVNRPLDPDGRIRCSYNIAGTKTFRFSSSESAFGTGTNLQNITAGESEELADFRGPRNIALPNLRRMFIPDPGRIFVEVDLDRADLQVVVWESGDEELKAMLREGVDIHAENAKVLGVSRKLAKVWVHGTNYGGTPRTMARHCGILVREAETLRKRWFSAHPGIAEWHRRTEEALITTRCVRNRFGYRIHFLGRVEGLLPEALAWIPQSTVALVIDKAWKQILEQLPWVRVHLQVHDSLLLSIERRHRLRVPEIVEAGRVPIPYEDPLVIPLGAKISDVSWGDCVE